MVVSSRAHISRQHAGAKIYNSQARKPRKRASPILDESNAAAILRPAISLPCIKIGCTESVSPRVLSRIRLLAGYLALLSRFSALGDSGLRSRTVLTVPQRVSAGLRGAARRSMRSGCSLAAISLLTAKVRMLALCNVSEAMLLKKRRHRCSAAQ